MSEESDDIDHLIDEELEEYADAASEPDDSPGPGDIRCYYHVLVYICQVYSLATLFSFPFLLILQCVLRMKLICFYNFCKLVKQAG